MLENLGDSFLAGFHPDGRFPQMRRYVCKGLFDNLIVPFPSIDISRQRHHNKCDRRRFQNDNYRLGTRVSSLSRACDHSNWRTACEYRVNISASCVSVTEFDSAAEGQNNSKHSSFEAISGTPLAKL
jgi:hypothetical protein